MNDPILWTITAATIALILIRPRHIPEYIWACAGALALVLSQRISLPDTLRAASRGTDVYLFLTGMMLLAELARHEGVFDWLASLAVKLAKGSRTRLFALVYCVGIAVTTFLSNDATAVVLTPAVLAAVKKARAKPLPYLLICAFIANAASFVLPISNPANLVLYGSKLPPLLSWLQSFGLASLFAIAATYAVLWALCRKDLAGEMATDAASVPLSPPGRRAAYAIAGTAAVLLGASAANLDLGLPTFVTATVAVALAAFRDRDAPLAILKGVSWSVLPLVAGLFVLVAAIDHDGALAVSHTLLRHATGLTAAFAAALLSNIANNLPVGLIAGSALQSSPVAPVLRNALVVGVDLGPNLSVTGSLATILWLAALRREGENITAWQFLRYGLLVMPPALLLAVLALHFNAR